MEFKKKARIPRKEKKRRARILHPIRKIKFTPYSGLTYEKLEAIVRDVFFPKPPAGPPLESYRMLFIDDNVDYTARTEKLTIDEIKERFSITEKEEEALREKMGPACNQGIEGNKTAPDAGN